MLSSSFFKVVLICSIVIISACKEKPKVETTPWGTTVSFGTQIQNDSTNLFVTKRYSLHDIQQTGEMIMLTLSGPDTYYEIHGKALGVHYMLCEKLAQSLGVTLRVDVCKDTLDMLRKLRDGEGDIIAFPVSKQYWKDFFSCGVSVKRDSVNKQKEGSWLIAKENYELAEAIQSWYIPTMYTEMKKHEMYLLTTGSVTRRVYPFMLSPKKGSISKYDHLFKRYSSIANVDWCLLAAQCYQESCFDPMAHSWAGACGLMQILPSTADHLALPRHKIYEPESNIAAAARYMCELQGRFADIDNPNERLMFALAAYNGGYYHVRDAMALTKKYGGVWQRWNDVRHYILALSRPQYYSDPVVKNGYMRGSETANYVDMIMSRYSQYRHALRTGGKINSNIRQSTHYKIEELHNVSGMPHHRASKKNKWRKDE